MTARTIENPVLNSPFQEPRRHFRFDDQGITSDIVHGRRPSSYFVPVPQSPAARRAACACGQVGPGAVIALSPRCLETTDDCQRIAADGFLREPPQPDVLSDSHPTAE